jgi:septal ring-binding cell division protein DamX
MTDIYQSPGDRLRFEILLKSLTEGSINLAVLSERDMVLDYYGSLFEERLRAKGETHIEWCSSTNSEQLVQKFNEILSEITLDQALEKDKKHAPRRFLVFRDSILMQDFELQLLARLVNGFPAGNISVILLINSAANYLGKVEAFGKNLIKWEVESDHGEAKHKLTDWVASEPVPVLSPTKIEPTFASELPTLNEEASPVSKLLNLPTKTAWRVPSFGKKEEPNMAAQALPAFVPPPVTVPLAPSAALPVLDSAPAATEGAVFQRAPRRSYAGWALLMMLLSVAALAAMNKDWVLQEAELFKKYLLRGTPAAPAPDEVARAAASDQALASAESAASAAAQASLVASQAQDAASAASAAAAPAPEQTAEQKVEPPAEAKSELKSEPKSELKVAPKPEVNPDEAWIKQLPANGYVVQLAAMDTQADMQSFQRSNAVYAKTRIMRARQKDTGKRYYILIAGPFETKAQADAFMQSSPLVAKGWLRSTKSMQTQFNQS